MKQVEFSKGSRRKVVWVDEHPFLKVGYHCSLIDERGIKEKWNIDKVHELSLDDWEFKLGWQASYDS